MEMIKMLAIFEDDDLLVVRGNVSRGSLCRSITKFISQDSPLGPDGRDLNTGEDLYEATLIFPHPRFTIRNTVNLSTWEMADLLSNGWTIRRQGADQETGSHIYTYRLVNSFDLE